MLGLSFVVLLGFTGLAVDAGYERYQQRAQQSATDSAAIAGASELIYTQSGAVTAARTESASNGFTHDGLNTIVAVNNPPASGSYAGNSKALEVVIDATRPTFFEQVLGRSTQTIETRSTALLAPPTRRPCIYELKPPPATLRMNSPAINAPNCGVVANGNYTSNSGSLTVAEIGVAGTISSNSTTYTEASPRASVAVADPCGLTAGCAYLAANPPDISHCDYNSLRYNSKTVTLTPGVYCGGTTFSASNVAMNPGVYVFPGGLTSNASTITGTGVTLVFPTGGVTTLNAGSFDITAPSSGNTAGVAFYQPPSNSSAITLNGGSGARNIQGAVYAPSADLTSNASFGSWTLLVAATITLNAGSMDVPTNTTFPGGIQSAVLTQ
ncbi:MAG: pilus assembly protein [Candidatus Velthaea sp.]